ncbi:zinc finger CCCH domain-containing protein 67-like isoform X2 [Vitis riparia]|uniref:zinc finger CCCH domain-containing protein 67-like isoform X2 n=1 Tax=Vitis riparia TaxID=96939 RepID=UPI00155AEBAC|nr:zinc finger CCCH domain-containing protein 67-like isoform X2 [Vitis riparia]
MDGSENTVSIPNEDELGLGLRPSSPPQPDVEKLNQEFLSLVLEQHEPVVESLALEQHEPVVESLALEQHEPVFESLALEEREEEKEEDEESESNGEVKASDDEEEQCENLEDESAAKDDKSARFQYPVRPDAVDCSFYLRTGTCKFGSNCKFNHPIRRKNQVAKEKVKEKEKEEFPERPGQTECKYYLRTGGCKFGKACRYNHTKAKPSAVPVLELNFLGLPIRMGEKECPYYMRTGSCKYGANCRFNHPDPTAAGGYEPPSGYGNGGSVPLQGASQSNMASWSSPRALNEPAPFVPIMFSPTQGVPPPNPEWNGYQAPLYPPPPPERSMHPPPAFVINNTATDANVYGHHQQQQQSLIEDFPERPGQPECSYFLKTGDCKFRAACKYHHPKNRIPKSPPCTLSDKGLPLRPDQNICTHYNRYGICKFGPACKFDHPVNYGNSASAPSVESGQDQPPPFGGSVTADGVRPGSGNGNEILIQQPV